MCKILYFPAETKFLSVILMFQKVPEKQGQNLPFASLYKIQLVIADCRQMLLHGA
jgi:hypothetical protein